MTFQKITGIWLLITLVSAALFYVLKRFITGHPLWPWSIPPLYIGVLILFGLYVLTSKKKS